MHVRQWDQPAQRVKVVQLAKIQDKLEEGG